jgi:hypothetical protein
MRGHLAEGQTRLERLLAADEAPTAARARALNGAAVMAISRGDPLAAKERERGRARAPSPPGRRLGRCLLGVLARAHRN